jgi:hypothetical protein
MIMKTFGAITPLTLHNSTILHDHASARRSGAHSRLLNALASLGFPINGTASGMAGLTVGSVAGLRHG